MPQMTQVDAERALTTALNMWLDQNPHGYQVAIGGQQVNIIYARNGNRLDFGFPNLYTLDPANLPNLTQWWHQQHDGCQVLPPQQEPASGVWKINAVLYPAKQQGVTLKFHIPLTRAPLSRQKQENAL